MTVSYTESPEHVEPRPPMSTKVDVDLRIEQAGQSPGRSRPAPCRRTYRPSGRDGRSVQAQEACRCAQAAAHYVRIFGTAGPPSDNLASQSAMGSPPVDVQPHPRKTHRPRIPEANVGGTTAGAMCTRRHPPLTCP